MKKQARSTKKASTARTERGRFAPGSSGNPGGRPKGLREFRLAARAYSAEALSRLVGIMRAQKADPLASARVRAIREIFDRAWGKPVQELQVQGFMGNVNVEAGQALSREEQVDVGRRMAFLLEAAAQAASSEANPTPRPVRRRIKPEELRRE